MIWLYIIGTIVAQAIVVVLLNEYLNRRGQPPAATPQQEDTPPAPSPSMVTEAKESEHPAINPATVDDAVGLSNFSSIRVSTQSLMGFTTSSIIALRSAEREARAWEDHRDEEAQLEREDNTVAPPNPLACGADFDSLTKASAIVQSDEPQPIGALQFAMNVFRTVDGTQFSGCLPDALLEKLYECHRRVEMNEALREEESETETAPAEAVPAKEAEVMQQAEEKPEPKPEPVIEPEVKEAPIPRFRMSFLNKTSQSQN